ncbi:MAG: hypothetical protein AB7K09_00350 [Planctomycetota bacterium]
MPHLKPARPILASLLLVGALHIPTATVVAQPGPATDPQPPATDPQPPATDPAAAYAAKLDAAAEKGRDYLLSLYGKDPRQGGWGPDMPFVGYSGLALNGLLRGRKPVSVSDERVKKTLDKLISQQQFDGAWVSPQRGEAVYETSVILRALVAAAQADKEFAAREDVLSAIRKGRDYLLLAQVDEHPEVDKDGKAIEGKVDSPDAEGGANYGGVGYGRGTQGTTPSANMSSTAMAMEAVDSTTAVIGEDDKLKEARKKLQNFLRHCHNLAEYNGKPYNTEATDTPQGKVVPGNDGGAVYAPGQSNAGTTEGEGGVRVLRSYGSVTYALLQLYHISGIVDRNDLRIQKAMEWITRSENFVFTYHPGLNQDDRNSQFAGHYYYLYTAAHTLSMLAGKATLEDSRGEEHNWSKSIGDVLLGLQQANGAWSNQKNSAYWENAPIIATSYALVALGYLR